MGSVSRSGFIRGVFAFSLMGAGLVVGGLGVLLLVQVVTGHESLEGNLFLTGLGVTLFVFSPSFSSPGLSIGSLQIVVRKTIVRPASARSEDPLSPGCAAGRKVDAAGSPGGTPC
jgi:hypothetical protein